VEFCNAFVASAGDPMQDEEGRRSRIAHFLDMGVPIDFEDPDGVTALLAAAVSGRGLHSSTSQLNLSRV
jgi:hypothetical protein